MHFRCPACMTQIEQRPNEDAPRSGVIYRCSVCRLELTLVEKTQIDVAPLAPDRRHEPVRRS